MELNMESNMESNSELQIVSAYDAPQSIRELFREYTDSLIAADQSVAAILEVQDFEAELEDVGKKYGLPDGRLYLAYWNGELAGCIGLHKIDGLHCEMKRLYVRPRFRSRHIGSVLVQKIIQDAREAGYRYIQLDTLPFLKDAIKMYRRIGFYEIEKYYDNPMDEAVYMQLDL